LFDHLYLCYLLLFEFGIADKVRDVQLFSGYWF
jgi:hypothetical protein